MSVPHSRELKREPHCSDPSLPMEGVAFHAGRTEGGARARSAVRRRALEIITKRVIGLRLEI